MLPNFHFFTLQILKASSRRYSGKLYCLNGSFLTVSSGDLVAPSKFERFEVSGADSVITALGSGNKKTIWNYKDNGWTKYYERTGLGKILDFALLNQKILGLREIGSGPGREIVFLDNNME